MPKHALVFVHGMGEFGADWCQPAVAVLAAAFSEYQAFKGTVAFADVIQPVPTLYSELFTKLREQWKSDVAGIKSTLGKEIDKTEAAGEKARVEKEIDRVAAKIGAGADTFTWTHAMDVVLYRFFALTRHATNVHLARQFLSDATSMKFSGWSVIAHSLGTAVTHNTLHALYTTELIKGQRPLQTVETRPKVLAMVANVSRVLQLPDLKVFSSKVSPGSALVDRACETYLNVRHRWDPFVKPQPFIPDSGWPDAQTFNSNQYQHIQPSHLLIKKYREVHDLEHYLKNPRVHVPIFRGILGDGVIGAAEFTEACTKFDGAVLNQNTNDIRAELEGLLPAESDSWQKLLNALFKLFGKGDVS